MTELIVPDDPKMLRETFAVAQALVNAPKGRLEGPRDRRQEHSDRLQRLVAACDRHRPVGPHTSTCGCEGLPWKPPEGEIEWVLLGDLGALMGIRQEGLLEFLATFGAHLGLTVEHSLEEARVFLPHYRTFLKTHGVANT